MENGNTSIISLADARQLVALLEQEKHDEASALIDATLMQSSAELFAEVGKLTRQLHDSLTSFHIDPRIAGLANEDIPDAQMRLTYVIDTTEQAANQTMDAIETCMPMTDELKTQVAHLKERWARLMKRDMSVEEFKLICHDVNSLLDKSDVDLGKLSSSLTDVLMAQGFQDLTGQVIRRVIELVTEVQDSLVSMLTMFGNITAQHSSDPTDIEKPQTLKDTYAHKAEGPIMDTAERSDVVTGQDDVDDLLSSLGF